MGYNPHTHSDTRTRPVGGSRPGQREEMPNEQEIRDLVRRALEEVRGTAPAASRPSPATASAATPGCSERGQTIALGTAHGGYRLKGKLGAFLQELGYQVRDCGTFGPESVDYPDFAHEVAQLVADGSCHWGVVVDGAGIGSAMAANKVPGVRAALCYDFSSATNSREHNHANVLTLGAGLIGEGLARQIVQTWLETPWWPVRHARRIDRIRAIEKRYLGVGEK